MIKHLFLLIRPLQWAKNAFIFLPLFFSGSFTDVDALRNGIYAFLAFSFTASSIYCFNDIWDIEKDRMHSKKKKRPLASGALSVTQGYVTMAVMAVLAATMLVVSGLAANYALSGIFIFYYTMNLAYCMWLKNYPIVDVFIIALGFVLRIMVGGQATDTVLSHWIVQMTFLLALFLAFAKRRDDVVIYAETGIKPRANTNRYNLDFMNQAISVIGAVTIVCYIMYTVSDEVIARFHNDYVYVTSIFVLAGILRYLHLTIVDINSGSPTRVLMKDRFTQGCLVAWAVSFAAIIYL